MPQGMDLAFTYAVRWAALDPSTGLPVAGVTIASASMLVQQVTPGTASDLATQDFAALLTPITLEDQSAPELAAG